MGLIHGEEIREASALEAHIGARAQGELILYRLPAFASDIYPGQRPGYAVIARGKDYDVECVLGIAGLDAIGVMRSMGASRTSTSKTLSRLYTS